MSRGLLVALIFILSLLLWTPCLGALDYSISVTPYPSSIIADASSFSTITAEVRDELGKSVPDGTSVDFTTSLGVIDRTGTTISGTARARLQSGAVTGAATVTVVVRGSSAVNRTRVLFVAPGEELPDETYVDVGSDQGGVGYDMSRSIMEAGSAVVKHRGVVIRAAMVQIDAERGILRSLTLPGDPDIEIKRGDKVVKASALYYDFSELGGVILTPEADGAIRMKFSAREMTTEPDQEADPRVRFDIVSLADASMYINADRVLLKPGGELKMITARVYFEGERVVTIPLHRIILGGQGAGSDRMVSYGSEGLRLDIPFYYMLTPTGTGAVRMKHSEQTGWGYYSETPGWQMDVEQQYTSGDSAGTVAVSRVGGSDWGMRWQQRQEYTNNSRTFTYLDFPQHRDLYGTLDYSRAFRDKTLSLTLRGSKPKDTIGRMAANMNLQTKMRPLIGKAVSALFSVKTTYDSRAVTDRMGGGLGMQLYGMPINLGGLTSLSGSLAASQVWGGSTPGHSVYGNAGIYKQLGGVGSITLNYNYIWESFSLGGTSQTVSADMSISPFKRVSLRLSGVKSLMDDSTSVFVEAGYWMGPRWEFRALGTRQTFQDYTFGDTQFVLVNYIGRQEARLVWSQSRRKFIFEFATGGF